MVDPGLVSLLQECHDTNTAVVVIPDDDDDDDETMNHKEEEITTTTTTTSFSPRRPRPSPPSYNYNHLPVPIHYHIPKSYPPNPLDLYEALNDITIQPRPFGGGSASFGTRQYADPERTPLSSRTVVLCRTVNQTRAARFCGMRVLCFHDNDLADAILHSSSSSSYDMKVQDEEEEHDYMIDFYLDDIATPGSYWLNPPNPRDDQGNQVDVYDLIVSYHDDHHDTHKKQQELVNDNTTMDSAITSSSSSSNEDDESEKKEEEDDDELNDDELQRILADLSPLL